MTDVIAITPSEEFESKIRAALDEWGDAVVRIWPESWEDVVWADAVDDVAAEGPRAVVIGPGIDADGALRLAELLDTRHPEISTVIVAEADEEMLRAAMRVGARGLVGPDDALGDVKSIVDQATDAGWRRRRVGPSPDGGSSTTNSRIVTVISPKGGSGKTTLATNLTVGLAASGRDVVVVDLDVLFGDVATALALEPESSIASAATQAENVGLDATSLKAHLARHESGAYVLAAPPGLDEADCVTSEHVKSILQLLSEEFELVVVDTASGIDDLTLVAMEQAAELVFVCTTDVPSVRGLRRQMDALDAISMVSQRRLLVLNRADARAGLTVADVELALGMPADARIPSSRRVAVATNAGRPLASTPRRDGLTKSFRAVVDLIDNSRRPVAVRFWRKGA